MNIPEPIKCEGYRCPYCGLIFGSKDACQNHMRTCERKPSDPVSWTLNNNVILYPPFYCQGTGTMTEVFQ